MRSTNDNDPFFGQRQPIYPEVTQILRVASGPDQNNVYPAFIQQQQSPTVPSLRDRESACLWEPNGLRLNVGDFYKARLIGPCNLGSSGSSGVSLSSGPQKPLFAVGTLCCQGQQGSFASSAVSAASARSASQVSQQSFQEALGCCFCPAIPIQWAMTVSGITTNPSANCPCGTCANYNGTFILTLQLPVPGSQACFWLSSTTTICDATASPPTDAIWQLSCQTAPIGSRFDLNAIQRKGALGIGVNYRASPINCLGPNVFNFNSDGSIPICFNNICSGWPATITLTPV
jgi:hypothetical protein